MPSNDAAPLLSRDVAVNKNASTREVEERRRHRREIMRRWRADPLHKAMERKKRREWYYAHEKLRPRRRSSAASTSTQEKRVCGFCWHRPAITTSLRLQVCDKSPEGFKEVRIPYCGDC